MIRHTNSFIISMIIHTLFIAALFISYKYISPSLSEKKETMVCVNLSCMVEHEKKKITKVVPSQVEKKVIQKSKPKKIKNELEPVKKKVYVQKVPKKIEEEQSVEVVSKPQVKKITKSHVLVTPTKSEVVIKESKRVSAEKKYVDENLVKIAQLLQENLYYPRRARKRGVQGEVLVKFNLSQNAEVTNVKVLSSKSDILSRGAIKTINDLSFKFPKPKEKLTLSVPILYKLN